MPELESKLTILAIKGEMRKLVKLDLGTEVEDAGRCGTFLDVMVVKCLLN